MAAANSSRTVISTEPRCSADDSVRHSGSGWQFDPRLEALRATRELARCSDRELRSLLPYVDEIAVPAGTRVAVEQQLCQQYLIVIEGRLRAHSRDRGCQTLCAGDSHGWTAMWERTANDSTLMAESDSCLLVMGHAQFRAAKAIAPRPAE